ncbi:hypothetical protein BKA93DRAFT_730012, partial [Sparassis latifolia]
MPLAINDLTDPAHLVTDPDAVKETTRQYFSKLYHHDPPPDIPKPWMTTRSVKEVCERVHADPFQWPQPASIAAFRAMLRKGNARPSPGPDEWEKWCIKSLSDNTLSLVLDLHNYMVMHAHFPVATQPGVQMHDLMSFLAGLKCWSSRHHQPIYTLKRDQMKGFDYLSPQGFYDAITAYGLPQVIIDLDRASQTDTRCFIRTAHGTTEPIIVTGVTKQGGSLSPVKSTYTTSLGHRYLNDIASQDPDTVIVSTSSAERGDPHLPEDHTHLSIVMAEATDDSYIFTKTLKSLRNNTLHMERFQFAYGWLTQWTKTIAYLLGTTGVQPPTLSFPSIMNLPGVDPLTVTEHTVPLVLNSLDFLRTNVDDPTAWFEELREYIDTFTFPTLIGRPPITLLRKIISQSVISRCRALLSLQPVKLADAEILDNCLMTKVHAVLGLPFRFNTHIAMLPIALHGMEFPSISRINSAAAVKGLARDLNHHVPAYRNMVRVMMADWTCDKNGCVYPLDGTGLSKDLS